MELTTWRRRSEWLENGEFSALGSPSATSVRVHLALPLAEFKGPAALRPCCAARGWLTQQACAADGAWCLSLGAQKR